MLWRNGYHAGCTLGLPTRETVANRFFSNAKQVLSAHGLYTLLLQFCKRRWLLILAEISHSQQKY